MGVTLFESYQAVSEAKNSARLMRLNSKVLYVNTVAKYIVSISPRKIDFFFNRCIEQLAAIPDVKRSLEDILISIQIVGNLCNIIL
ncbi:hypothetical protein BuS5_03261 [Desulfosarcina sp. BuS5]|nr:hypothetical protein BuS5_03261 [Desulfosarcina sp. BuS5]